MNPLAGAKNQEQQARSACCTPPGTAGATSPLPLKVGKDRGHKRSTEAASPDARSAAKDRVIRVFVSSTFRDMVEDRNELMAHVWPALRKVCRGRSVEFVDVDLRWGVTEEQSQRKETLRHCLAEIKRCRPYFIGLLADLTAAIDAELPQRSRRSRCTGEKYGGGYRTRCRRMRHQLRDLAGRV
jgi:hypothetical protein